MARLSKDEIVKQLTALGVKYDANAEYTDLCELLKASQSADGQKSQVNLQNNENGQQEIADELTKTQDAKDLENKRQAAVFGAKPVSVVELHPQQSLEKKIRGFVAKSGGFRKGLNSAQIELAKVLLKKRDGKDLIENEIPRWDTNIALPGYDV